MKKTFWLLFVSLFLPFAHTHAQILDRPVVMRVAAISTDTDDLTEKLLESASTLTQRLVEAGLTGDDFSITVTEGNALEIATTLSQVQQILPLVNNVGLLEFVDFSDLGIDAPQAGDCILTTAQMEQFKAALCASPLVLPNDDPFVTVLAGGSLSDAHASLDTYTGEYWIINFSLDEVGSSIFADYTSSHIGQPLAIVLNGEVISAPIIQAEIAGEGVIAGTFSKAEAQTLALILKTGSLPLPLYVVEIIGAP